MLVAVRRAGAGDMDGWVQLRCALWPSCSEQEHRQEVATLFREGPWPMVAFVAEEAGALRGFVEVSVRPYAEGCRTGRVGYLEGWFVEPGARARGVGRRLVAAAEEWARSQGCSELASDAEADDDSSAAAHRAMGFADLGLVRCFRKDL